MTVAQEKPVGPPRTEPAEVVALRVEFVDLIGHALRSPLTNISVLAELLLDGELPDETRRPVEVIHYEAGRLARLIEGALDLSRAHHGQLAIRARPVDLSRLCACTVQRMAVVYPDRSWLLEVGERVPLVMGDAERIEHVLRNLLDNAARYAPEGTDVVTSVVGAPDGDKVVCTVADAGHGIDPAEAERVFDRYHRLENEPGRTTHGHGLGLYIARRLTELQGGRIWVDGFGHGTRFSFELPAAGHAPG